MTGDCVMLLAVVLVELVSGWVVLLCAASHSSSLGQAMDATGLRMGQEYGATVMHLQRGICNAPTLRTLNPKTLNPC